jgi:hypothetical protein
MLCSSYNRTIDQSQMPPLNSSFPALIPALFQKQHLPLHHRIVLQHAQGSGYARSTESAIVTCHRHANETHGDCAGFGWNGVLEGQRRRENLVAPRLAIS